MTTSETIRPQEMDRTVLGESPNPTRLEPMGAADRLAKRVVEQRLSALPGGGITVVSEAASIPDDRRPRIRVRDPRFYRRVIRGGTIGAAEAYMNGWWECDDLAALIRALVRHIEVADGLDTGTTRIRRLAERAGHWLRRNTRRGSRRNIHAHYDLGNDFFRLFLDPSLTYSCGIFEEATSTLEEASQEKLDRICRKLRLAPHDRLLEIGSGWGSFALHAAANYGCRVTTTTISSEQFELARERVAKANLSERVTVLLEDYRQLTGRYDKIVSIEMIEAVGHEFLPEYFGKCSALLERHGAMLLQAITMPDHRYERYRRSVDFIRKYIFPGSCVPSVAAMSSAIAKSSDMRLTHLEDIGIHYATTLRHWRERFLAHREDVRALGHSESFVRLWEFYLAYCEAGFAERYLGDVHMLLVKPGWSPSVVSSPGEG